MPMTNHARARCQQRGVKSEIVSLIVECADRRRHVGGGCLSLSLTPDRVEGLRRKGLISSTIADRLARMAVVVDAATRTVITVIVGRGRRMKRYRSGW